MIKQFAKLLTLASVLVLSGCSYYDLEDIQPIDSVPAGLAITDLQSAEAARAGVYNSLQDNNFDRFLAGVQYFSDECDWTGTFPTRAEFDIYNVVTGNNTLAGMFTSHYNTINVANNVIEILPTVESPTIDEDSRNSILAEARFARALSYFELVQNWQEVPLVLTPTRGVGDELNVARNTVDQVYSQVIEDFTFAANNLVDGKSIGATVAAANAMLARIALYQERWDDARSLANAAVGDDYDLTAIPYLQDQIFFIEFSATDGNSLAFFYGPSDLNGRYSIAPSDALVDAYEDGDLRFEQSIAFADNGDPYGIKYDDFAVSSGAQTDPIRYVRGAEMVLIMAEANARMGDFDTASDMINMVRSRAGLDDVSLDDDNFVDAILQERFVELAMESGHRLWDLRRTGRALDVLGPGGYDPCDDVWPLPQRDIDRNPNLMQNDCCNC